MARYIIRASFSQERMMYLENEGTVVYRSKDGKNQTTFPALEWLAAMCSHIPNKGMVITVTSLGENARQKRVMILSPSFLILWKTIRRSGKTGHG
jgi:hypothetical protein